MKALGLVAVALAVFVVACGGGSSSSNGNTTPVADAEVLRDEVVAAMEQMESFRAVFTLDDYSFLMDVVQPDSYRTELVANDNQTGEPTLGEVLYVDHTIYARKCEPDGLNCGDWDNTPREPGIVELGSYDPRWPIIALDMADGLSSAGDMLEGEVNHIRAVMEHTHRMVPSASIDDLLQDQEPGLSFADEHPSRIQVAFDPATHLIKRLTLDVIEENYDASFSEQSAEIRTIVFIYSDYNEITIEAPD